MTIFLVLFAIIFLNADDDDSHGWLEDVTGKKSLKWVKKQNKKTTTILQKSPFFPSIFDKSLEIYNSKERIHYPSINGNYVYNFLQDDVYKKGLWRRTSIKNYTNSNIKWEHLLDIDALSKKENENWVFKGATGLKNNYMIHLSRGGGDAVVIREFDIETKEFKKNGYFLPEAKSSVNWIDKNTLMVATDFGKNTKTKSGYARIIKLWKRGQDLNKAKTLIEGDIDDVGVWGSTITAEKKYHIITRLITFYSYQTYILQGEKALLLPIPEDAEVTGFFKGMLLLQLKSDWQINNTYKQGSLLAIDYNKMLKGEIIATVLMTPTSKSSISSVDTTKNYLLINTLTNVSSKLYKYTLENKKWESSLLPASNYGNINIISSDATKDFFFYSFQNFLTPTTLYLVTDNGQKHTQIKSLPEFFPGKKYEVEQVFTTSKDGTKIPYFIVYKKGIVRNKQNPALLYGYGGFEISLRPSYSAVIGSCWLEQGGIYILANIRGGGEFGPKWHHAALKENRQKAYDDFLAIAEDVIAKKFTSSEHLGIMGGSNGGLLVGVAFTQRPDLFNAVVCRVPLLDMKRFNKLLAGASWMGEYGNPDIPEEWEYIKKYSPYHNVIKNKKYPKVFFNTSTRDDRVHPGHARKMVAKMQELGHDVYYYENMEGGHAAATTNDQRAFSNALIYSYLLEQLK